jgi:OmpA family/PEGA domain
MRMKRLEFGVVAAVAAILVWMSPARALGSEESGRVKIHVKPKQAYVFVDGKAMRQGSQTIRMTPGAHTVEVTNYGYVPQTQKVQVSPTEKATRDVDLEHSGDKVSGPFADLEFKGDRRAAVLLNGVTPAYFVGHVDEFNWDWIWHQRLLVQPGTYHVTVEHQGNTIWSGDVTAKAGQKVIVYLDKDGKKVIKNFHAGEVLGPQPRFHAGILNSAVVPAPLTANLASTSEDLGCGQSATLKWDSANAVNTSISGFGSVPGDGTRVVTPTHDITYVLKAVGPGGDVTKTITVDVNTKPTATVALSQSEIRFHKIGDKIVEQGSTTLRWSADNAKTATINPFGAEQINGSRTITANPDQTAVGPVNENITYTFSASNPCGGTATQTATLHVVGSIDPPPSKTLASLYYPTAYPTRRHPKLGLVPSEKAVLNHLADQFRDFGNYEQHAGLTIIGYADVRGPEKYNHLLSERRAELAKDYLVSKGVPAAELKVEAKGKDDQIALGTVESLQARDSQKPDKWMNKKNKATWLAYNRRVDIVLEPTGQQSTKLYPNDIASAHLLWQRPEPSLRAISKFERNSSGNERASLTMHGN